MLTLKTLPLRYAVSRLDADAPLPGWAMEQEFFSATRTPEELSIVCPESAVPADTRREPGWRILKVSGPLDFAEVGHLASITAPLARAGMSVFAISTYDTDYLLVKADALDEARDVLAGAGHDVT